MHVEVSQDSLVITVDHRFAGTSVIGFLEGAMRLPSHFVMHILHEGRVQSQRMRLDGSEVLAAGQRLRLTGDVIDAGLDTESFLSPPVTPAAVLYEDDHVLVVNKPAGVIMYPGPDGEPDTLQHRVRAYYALTGQTAHARHVHRLDRETTGAVLYAKHAYIARALDTALQQREIRREYIAITLGTGRIPRHVSEPIGRDRHRAGRYRVSPTGKPARTNIETLASVPIAGQTGSLVACSLETGRTHQIRVHLSATRNPILGDTLYGGAPLPSQADNRGGLALHARRLSFIHPYDERDISVVAPLPDAWLDWFHVPAWSTLLRFAQRWGEA